MSPSSMADRRSTYRVRGADRRPGTARGKRQGKWLASCPPCFVHAIEDQVVAAILFVLGVNECSLAIMIPQLHIPILLGLHLKAGGLVCLPLLGELRLERRYPALVTAVGQIAV